MPRGKLTYRRGEIYWVTMDPTVGAEVQKTSSCLVVQNDTMNQYGEVTIVLPFRPGSKQAPYSVNVKASPTNGLDKDRFVDVGQIRAVSYQRWLCRKNDLRTGNPPQSLFLILAHSDNSRRSRNTTGH